MSVEASCAAPTLSVVAAAMTQKPHRMPPTAQCAGVTTFIKTELIADGVGRAHVPRIGGARNGMINGQRVDRELRAWIDRGGQGVLKHAGSRHVVAGLRRMGIQPLQAQVRVTDPDLKLTTLIDAVGEGPNNTLWVIEIKTTTLTSANHIKSYRRVCTRTPAMRNGVTHTEQAGHFLQAAFGALALRRLYNVHPDIPVMACVVVATADACRTYVCPDGFMDRRLFKRRAPVPLLLRGRPNAKNDSKRTHRPQPGTTPGLAKWPERGSAAEKMIDAALLRYSLVRNSQGKRRSVWAVCQAVGGRKGRPVGVVALISKEMHNLPSRHRASVVSKLSVAAKRLLAQRPEMAAAARLAISVRTCALAPCPGPLGRV